MPRIARKSFEFVLFSELAKLVAVCDKSLSEWPEFGFCTMISIAKLGQSVLSKQVELCELRLNRHGN